MGFIIKYRRFFNVMLSEESIDNPIGGFTFFPTRACRRVLNNYNMVFRQRPSGFEVFFSEMPVIPIENKTRFSFGFTLPGSGIFKKYGLEKTNESDTTVYHPGLYFDNLNPDGSIITDSPASLVAEGFELDKMVSAPDTCKIFGQTFKVFDSTEGTGTPPSSYELSHRYDEELKQTIPVPAEPGADYVVTTINSVNLKEEYISESGPYVLKADTDPPPDRNVYLDDELGRKTVHGVVDIYWETAQDTVSDAENGQEYKITFKLKSS